MIINYLIFKELKYLHWFRKFGMKLEYKLPSHVLLGKQFIIIFEFIYFLGIKWLLSCFKCV
jgi:hypothetical protein